MKIIIKALAVFLIVAVGWFIYIRHFRPETELVSVNPTDSSIPVLLQATTGLTAATATPELTAATATPELVEQTHNTCADWEIIPAVRVGSVTANLKESDLIAMFGREMVKNLEIHVGEGEYSYGTSIFPGDGDKALNIIWTNREHVQIAKVIVVGKKWRTKSGIGIGARLMEIEKANGKPFTMVGFRFDGEGSIVGWNGGALQAEGEYLRLAFKDPGYAGGTLSKQERDSLTGSREFLSSNPVLQKTNPYIKYMDINWSDYDYAQTE